MNGLVHAEQQTQAAGPTISAHVSGPASIDQRPSAASVAAVDAPVPAQSWAPNLPDTFSISVESPQAQPRDAWGSASSRGVFPFSTLGRLEHFCSTPAAYPLRIRFYTDSVATPRPQPFRPPTLSVTASFTPAGGSPRSIADVADATPRYDGPGWPLAPAFGELFTASSSASGALTVQARLNDSDTTASLTYRDTVTCELVPCA